MVSVRINDLPYRNLDLYASDLAEIQISVGEVIDPPWRGDMAKVTSKEIQISVGEVIDPTEIWIYMLVTLQKGSLALCFMAN